MFSGCRALELCASHGHRFPEHGWCSNDTVIRLTGASYEHGDSLTENRCPTDTPGCSASLTNDTWRSLVDECDGKTGCSVLAGRRWSDGITCKFRGRTDYMKIVYDCVDQSAAAAGVERNTAACCSDDVHIITTDADRQYTSLSQSRLFVIITTTGLNTFTLYLPASLINVNIFSLL